MVSSLLFVVIDANAITYFPPPLKQISDGVLPENVTCTEGLIIILKSSNNSPACVKPSSADKLIQRGWATEIPLQSTAANFESEIAAKAIAIWQSGLDKEQSEIETEYIQGPTEDGYQIALYDVSGDDIILNESPVLPSDLLPWQQDTTKHHEIWNVFTDLIPKPNRNVNHFFLTTDGVGAIGGGVNRDASDISMWNLFYDISDVYPNGIFDENEVMYTSIHEFGHIVTSDPNQIDVYVKLVNSSPETIDELYDIKSQECFPNVMTVDGCAKNDSYIALFYQEFWIDIISEWDEIQYIEDENEYLEQSDLFYEKYQDQFVSVYSSANLDEDIAESWTAFVLNEKPMGETISEQKIQFFYDFPELVKIRDHIRKGLV